MSLQRVFKTALGASEIGGLFARLPFARPLYKRYALNRRDHPGLFCGVYASYDDAEAQVAPERRGWDSAAAAGLWTGNIAYKSQWTYPPMMWLSKLLRETSTVVDFGGSVGLLYYAYRRIFALPEGARWIVVEVPEIAAAGVNIARQESAPIEFMTALESAPPADVLHTAGAIQYVRDDLPTLFGKLAAKPRHVLINKLPVTKGEPFWTLQNFSVGVSPYRVFGEDEVLGFFAREGYVLRDRWEVHELDCAIPFYPERHVPVFAGFYFEREDGPQG
ncbi:TIGR04325 family methyltransferase [Methylocella sp.]|uniref:TIGR04325 family methyltransferase n=1 Tax=Methylocella sp. TaxID=1978226 RepID=UPI003784F615